MAPPNPTPLESPFFFNPHIIWDPIGPWLSATAEGQAETAKELMLIRLQHQKDTLALQSKAIDQAIGVINKARR